MVNGYLYIPKVKELDGGIYRCAKTITFLNASCRYPIKGSYQGFWGSGEKCHFQGLMKKGYLFSGMSKASKILFFLDGGGGGGRGAWNMDLRKNILGIWGERSFFFQGAYYLSGRVSIKYRL